MLRMLRSVEEKSLQKNQKENKKEPTVIDQEETTEKEKEEETKRTEDQTKTDNKEKDLKELKSRLLKPHSPYSSET